MSYSIIQQSGTQHAHIKFDGPFQGKMVTWNTYFFTFDGYHSKHKMATPVFKQFIDVKPAQSNTMELTVVLNIAEINKPNIQKMMIMIKQYKNLTTGRHEYG